MRKIMILFLVLVCLLGLYGVTHSEPAQPSDPTASGANPYGPEDFAYFGQRLICLAGEAVTGIDVSVHQGAIDWEAVAGDGIRFAMVRVGYRGIVDGEIDEDVNARTNIEGALAAGLDVGVYVFSQTVSPAEAKQEAEFVLRFIADYDISMPVVFDWEHVENPDARTADLYDKELLTQCALAFLQTVEDAGYEPMVYFNRYQSEDLLDLQVLEAYDYWLALYDAPMTFPLRIDMWQYSDHGTVEGIDEKVDLNLYFP